MSRTTRALSALETAMKEYGGPLMETVKAALPEGSVEEWVAAAERILGSEKPVVRHVITPSKRAAKAPGLAVAAPAIIKGRSGSPLAVAQDVLHEAANPSKSRVGYGDWRAANPDNGELFDLSDLSRVPDVPQHQIPRYEPARGPSPRMVDALSDLAVRRKINNTVKRGIEGGGKDWYNTEPVLDRMNQIMPTIDAPPQYAALMDLMAATSPRSKVPDNIRTGSYYNYRRANDLPIEERPAGGYGSIAQNLHRDNARGLAVRGGWDIYKNPKPASFSSNLQGNQAVATIDTHNMRLPGILSQDPRFLESSVTELAKSPEAAYDTLKGHYPELPEDVVAAAIRTKDGETSITYRPQEWVHKGYISMKKAAKDPGLWATKPRDNEYGYYEKWQQQQAKKLGISPAQYQASMWLGGGLDTGLGSAPEPFVATLEARIRYTADQLGLDPEVVRDMMLKGEIPLLADGGPVRSLAVQR